MACRPYNTGRCLLLRLFNPSKLWGSLHVLSLCPFVPLCVLLEKVEWFSDLQPHFKIFFLSLLLFRKLLLPLQPIMHAAINRYWKFKTIIWN